MEVKTETINETINEMMNEDINDMNTETESEANNEINSTEVDSEGKRLKDYIKHLEQIEEKTQQMKDYITSLKKQINEKSIELQNVSSKLNVMENNDKQKVDKIDKDLIELLFEENQNQILSKQIEVFEQKVKEIKEKMSETTEKKRQLINEFNEQTLKFIEDYGPKGRIHNKIFDLKENIEKLKVKRNELKRESNIFDENVLNEFLNEYKVLNERIESLETIQTTLQKENKEINLINAKLSQKLQEIKENESKELVVLKKKLQQIEEMQKQTNSKPKTMSKGIQQTNSNSNVSTNEINGQISYQNNNFSQKRPQKGFESKGPQNGKGFESKNPENEKGFESKGPEKEKRFENKGPENEVQKVFQLQQIWELKRERSRRTSN